MLNNFSHPIFLAFLKFAFFTLNEGSLGFLLKVKSFKWFLCIILIMVISKIN